jgi:thymidylate synthase (FAD)
MRVIDASFEVLDCPEANTVLRKIERIGRVAYKSEDKITETSAAPFVKMLLTRGHESVLEHASATVMFTCDRGISHELVRHRIASFTQSSTRYCNYAQGKFGEEITVVKPFFWEEDSTNMFCWRMVALEAEGRYLQLIDRGAKPEQARSVLPNSLATEVVVTANLREWRHILKLRTAKAAHPQMREIACKLLKEFQRRVSIVFDDINNESESK